MFRDVLVGVSLLWAGLCLVVGLALGGYAFHHMGYPVYFLLPLVLCGGAGAVPAVLPVLLARARTRAERVMWVGGYLAVLGALCCGVLAWRGYYEVARDCGPYLLCQDDAKTTMTICWCAESPSVGRVEYMAEGGGEWKTAECPATHCPKVRLDGLQAGSVYRYRVPALGGSEHRFRTGPARPEDFSFAVYGDSHVGGISFHRSVLRAMLREEPLHGGFRFIVHCGDIVESPGEGFGWQWHTFLSDIAPLAASRPYEVVLGNHDALGGRDSHGMFFDYAPPAYWRFLDYSGVRFIVLSTEDSLEPGSPQYAWLSGALDSRPAETRFTVVAMHRPLLTHETAASHNNRALHNALEPLFTEKKVDIVFTGHVHAYEHLYFSGFDQVVTGGGGVLLWKKPSPGPKTVKTETCWHFCAVDVKETEMRVRAVRTDGRVLDEFAIPARKS